MSDAVAGGIPGLALLVKNAEDGTWASAKGSVDLRNGIPFKRNTLSRIGSVTKMFTAVVILQLEGEGRLSLDDPLARYLPAGLTKGIENADIATIRQLLNHSSGIADYSIIYDPPAFFRKRSNKDTTSLEVLDLVRGRPAAFKPGAGCSYSTTNFVLLGLVAEKASGKRMGDLYRERIFAPLGLKSTYYDPENPVHRAIARGYVNYQGNLVDMTDFDQGCRTPDGGIVSTVYDLATFIEALFQDRCLLSPDAFAEMTSDMLWEKRMGAFCGLGILKFEMADGETLYGHPGGHQSYSAELWYMPAKKLASTQIAAVRGRLSSTADQISLRNVLDNCLKQNAVAPKAPAYTVYHGASGREYDVEVVQTVAKPGENSSLVKFRRIDPCEVAAIVVNGRYEQIPRSYEILREWIAENGYEQAGPNREYYFRGEWNETDPMKWLTELQIPVDSVQSKKK